MNKALLDLTLVFLSFQEAAVRLSRVLYSNSEPYSTITLYRCILEVGANFCRIGPVQTCSEMYFLLWNSNISLPNVYFFEASTISYLNYFSISWRQSYVTLDLYLQAPKKNEWNGKKEKQKNLKSKTETKGVSVNVPKTWGLWVGTSFMIRVCFTFVYEYREWP